MPGRRLGAENASPTLHIDDDVFSNYPLPSWDDPGLETMSLQDGDALVISADSLEFDSGEGSSPASFLGTVELRRAKVELARHGR